MAQPTIKAELTALNTLRDTMGQSPISLEEWEKRNGRSRRLSSGSGPPSRPPRRPRGRPPRRPPVLRQHFGRQAVGRVPRLRAAGGRHEVRKMHESVGHPAPVGPHLLREPNILRLPALPDEDRRQVRLTALGALREHRAQHPGGVPPQVREAQQLAVVARMAERR